MQIGDSKVSNLAVAPAIAEHETPPPTSLNGDLLKGVKQIAEFSGLPERQVFHLCSSGQLPGAFKLGRLWYARKSTLLDKLRLLEEGAA